MKALIQRASHSLKRRWSHTRNNGQIELLNQQIAEAVLTDHARPQSDAAPVIFFNASTRLQGLSLNAAYNLIASWAVRLAGVPVVHFVCQSGLSRCVLGTQRDNPAALPPCSDCIAQSRSLYRFSDARWFLYRQDDALKEAVQGLSLDGLMRLEWQSVPLGRLALASMRWVLRRHHLLDDEPTRFLYRQYLLSAWRVHQEFSRLLDEVQPRAVVVFNGMFYPEATARWTAWQRGLPVISHEVGLQPYTAFFTPGDATAYPIQIPDSFQLTPAQNDQLDAYLSQRIQGNFSMAGVRFWPEMRGLDASFLERAAHYRQIVPVFTNVIFDTSQPHSNVVFPHMFAWLDHVMDLANEHLDTLFVIRAHPDESRPGKESRESVADWVAARRVTERPNVVFVPSQEYISSYELIQRSRFVMVYNSTIGLEAAIMGAPVLCAGKARFTQLPTVFFPESQPAYRQTAESLLSPAPVEAPPEFQSNARRFLYYQLYRSSLPFHDFIEEDGIWKGYVRLKKLDYQAFHPRNHPDGRNRVLRILVDGILEGKEFIL